jgi:hypothetical protein
MMTEHAAPRPRRRSCSLCAVDRAWPAAPSSPALARPPALAPRSLPLLANAHAMVVQSTAASRSGRAPPPSATTPPPSSGCAPCSPRGCALCGQCAGVSKVSFKKLPVQRAAFGHSHPASRSSTRCACPQAGPVPRQGRALPARVAHLLPQAHVQRELLVVARADELCEPVAPMALLERLDEVGAGWGQRQTGERAPIWRSGTPRGACMAGRRSGGGDGGEMKNKKNKDGPDARDPRPRGTARHGVGWRK